jgi:hypothetical protein
MYIFPVFSTLTGHASEYGLASPDISGVLLLLLPLCLMLLLSGVEGADQHHPVCLQAGWR